MTQILAAIASQADEESPFQEERSLRELQSHLALMSDDVPTEERWRLLLHLGSHELRLGDNESAVAHFSEAYSLLPTLGDGVPSDESTWSIFDVGLAYLRSAITQNCVSNHTGESCLFPIQGRGIDVNQTSSRQAIVYLTEYLEHAPDNLTARWLLNIAYMTIGEYPDKVPDEYRIAEEAFASEEDFPRFQDIAPQLGLDSYSLAGGSIMEDFDNDGFLDIVTSTADPRGQLRYFHNNGDGTLTDYTAQANLTGLLGGLNLVQADYDNDGNTDVLVLRGAWLGRQGRHPNSLLRNNGDGTFSDVTFGAGLAEVNYPTVTAAWADYDNDGDLDLYIGNQHDAVLSYSGTHGRHGMRLTRPPDDYYPSQLFRNNGDGTFSDVAEAAGVTNMAAAAGVTWGDIDHDRFPDLYVSNMGGANRLYHNNGDGTFTDVARQQAVTEPILSFPAWFWDFNNDGALDLFIAGNTGQLRAVAAGYLGLGREPGALRLYRGDGRGGFEDVTISQNLTRAAMVMGANFGDLDNDGFPDIYLGTGYTDFEALMPNVMYRNRSGEGFADVTTAGGFGQLMKGHGIAFGDLDNDGDQEIFSQCGGAFAGDAYQNALYENPGVGNHWLTLKLIGRESNRSAIGVRIRLEVEEGERRRSIYAFVNSGGSFGSNSLQQEIGLGRATEVKLLEVFWPTSGKIQTFTDVPGDQTLEITEGLEEYRTLRREPIAFRSSWPAARLWTPSHPDAPRGM